MNGTIIETELKKRDWVYVLSPDRYEFAPCKCGEISNQWSEYEGHLWCSKCKIDFIPEHNGIFDGPIPVETCKMLGISFDRFNLVTDNVEKFEV